RARARRSRHHWAGGLSQGQYAELLAVLGFVLDGEAEAGEVRFGPVFTGLPQGGELLEAALAGFVGEGEHSETTDTAPLRFRGDMHAPDTAAELLLSRIRVEIFTNEADDGLPVEHYARPRSRRVEKVVG